MMCMSYLSFLQMAYIMELANITKSVLSLCTWLGCSDSQHMALIIEPADSFAMGTYLNSYGVSQMTIASDSS